MEAEDPFVVILLSGPPVVDYSRSFLNRLLRLTGKLRSFVETPRDERLEMIGNLILFSVLRALLRLFGFRATVACVKLLAEAFDRRRQFTDIWTEVRRIARVVAIARRNSPHGANCLRFSLVLWFQLRRRSIPAELCIGFPSTPTEEWAAHAWIEVAGEQVGEQRNVRRKHVVFDGLPDRLEAVQTPLDGRRRL